MIAENLPILLILVPLCAAPLCVLFGRAFPAYWISLIASACVFATAIGLAVQVHSTGPIHYDIGGWEPPYGIEYVVDALSSFVMLFVSALGFAVLLYAPHSVKQEIQPSKHYLFYATYLLCLTGLLGICVTGDLFNVFVFLEISSLSSYALISLGKSRRALLAALRYLIVGSVGATFILIGIGLLYQMTGTLNMAGIAERIDTEAGPRTVLVALAFMTVGFCIKMAVFPLHSWLPSAYTEAPTVVTAFIAATATKVSVYAFIRLIFGILTPKFAFEVLELDSALMALSLMGIFVASTAAVFQDDVKRLLAYSSVAQIGYMLLGVSMASEGGLTAGIVHMFNHALIKGGLFMVAGCFIYRLGSSRLSDWAGAGKTMPWTALAWSIGGLGLIGVPLTAGFVSKWLLLTSAFQRGWWYVAVLMLLSSLLAVVYVWRVVETLYFCDPPEKQVKQRKRAGVTISDPPARMLIPTYLVIGAVVLFGVWTTYSAGLASAAAHALIGGGP